MREASAIRRPSTNGVWPLGPPPPNVHPVVSHAPMVTMLEHLWNAPPMEVHFELVRHPTSYKL